METQRFKTFVLGFMLPFMVFMLAVAPAASTPVAQIAETAFRSETKKVLAASVELGEQSEEDSSEDALVGGENKIHQSTCILDIAFLLTHPDFTEHRILDHAHDGRGPPSIS